MYRHSDQTRAVIREMLERGYTAREIERLTGVGKAAIRSWVRSWGMTFRRDRRGGLDGVAPRRLPEAVRPVDTAVYVSGSGHGRRLELVARWRIHECLREQMSVRQIAGLVGVSASTVSREVRRSTGDHTVAYDAPTAERLAGQRRRRGHPGILEVNQRLRGEVIAGLAKQWSPEQISHRLRTDYPDDRQMRVSHETIYQALYVTGRGSLRHELAVEQALRSGRKTRKPRSLLVARPDGKSWIDGATIDLRPAEVEERTVPGHWEGDLILGRGNHTAAITLVERYSRYTLIRPLPNRHDSPTVVGALTAMIGQLPEGLAKTLTWDQGSEMALYHDLQIASAIRVYFADPHSPWERGSNENTNGLLRQYFPKGADLAAYPEDRYREVQDLLNDRPRETLGWRTPREALTQALHNGVALTT